MQRSLVFALILALAAVLGAVWFLSRGTTLPPPPPVSTAPQPAAADPAAANAATTAARDATALATDRQMVAARPTALLDDPEILAGLTGWKGRVVDHEKTPVAGCGVRLYRGAPRRGRRRRTRHLRRRTGLRPSVRRRRHQDRRGRHVRDQRRVAARLLHPVRRHRHRCADAPVGDPRPVAR